MEVNRKEIRDARGRARSGSGKWTEKAKNPRKDLLTRTVPGNVTSRDSSARYHEEPPQGEDEWGEQWLSGHAAQEERE